MKNTKIVHLTSVHPPFDTRIFEKECKVLVRAGYEVALVAPHTREEAVEGIRVRGVPRSKNRLARMTHTVWRVYRAAIEEGGTLYHFHDPELIPVGILLKLSGKRVVYDVHEDFPRDILDRHWLPPWARRSAAKATEILEALGARIFDGIVAATPVIAKRFPSAKTVTVQNFPIPGELVPPKPPPYTGRPSLAVYVGQISAGRGVREMVRAIALAAELLGIRLILAGTFSTPALEEEVKRLPGWKYVDYIGWQSRKEIASLFARTRVGLVLLHPTPSHIAAQPTKLFEYMSAGLPVIASDFPLWREIIGGAGCGILVDPLDTSAIAEAIAWLTYHPQEAEAMGKCGQEAVRAKYSWATEAEKLYRLYYGVLPPGKRVADG